MHPQKPLCINAESWFDFANFGKQSTSNIDLSFFKNLNISVDKTKNPPLINSFGFSIIFFYFIFCLELKHRTYSFDLPQLM